MSLGWKLSNSALLAARSGHKVFAFNERVFAIGGQSSGSAMSLLVESAVVDQGGNLNAFKVTSALPPALNAGRSNFGLAQSALSGLNRIYLVGGENANGTTAYTDVAIGLVNTDGSILWSVGPALPTALAGCQAAIMGSWLYCIGGTPVGSATNAITPGGGDIALSIVSGDAVTLTLSAGATWTSPPAAGTTITIPSTSSLYTAHAANGGTYLVTGTSTSTVVHATKIQDLTGGTLTAPVAVTATPTAAGDVQTPGAQPQATNVLAAKIQSDGSLGPWLKAAPCPIAVAGFNLTGHLAMGSKSWLYVGGGLPQGAAAGSQFIFRARADQGAGQNLYWDREQLGMSKIRVNAGAPALLLGPLAIVGGSTDGTAANALASNDELRLSGDGSIIQLLAEDALPTPLMGAQVCALNNQFFAVGGQNTSGTYLASVYQATLQSNVTF